MSSTKVKIWVSDFPAETRLMRKIRLKLNIEEPTSSDFVECQNLYNQGIPAGPEDVSIYPAAMYYQYPKMPESYETKWRDIFRVHLGLVIVSERVRDLLQEFNIGPVSFRELPLYENDQEALRPEGPFYLMQILNFHDAFVPEAPENLQYYERLDKWRATLGVNDILAVEPAKIDGADMWMARNLPNRVFFSDRLRQAIKKAKFRDHGASFKPCIIVQ